MKYKAIKSAAHNFARSFASSLNWAESDYVMSHLLRAAIATHTQKYHIDLATGILAPSAGVPAGVRDAIGSQAMRLPDLLRSQRLDPSRLSRPTMSVQFDIDGASVFEPPGEYEAAFTCTVELLDDHGVVHRGGVSGRWGTNDLSGEPLGPMRRVWRWFLRRIVARRAC
jgi:hypothetical protein